MSKKSKKHPVTQAYLAAIKAAIKRHGEYQFYDKGAREVMEVDAGPLLALPQAERVQVVKELMASKHGDTFCSTGFGDFDYEGLSEADATELFGIVEGTAPSDKPPVVVPVKRIGVLIDPARAASPHTWAKRRFLPGQGPKAE